MKKHITKQKFYEEVILKSYEHSYGTALESEAKELQTMMAWPPKSFAELMVNRGICGFALEIPKKQQFDKLGFSYIAQVLGFVVRTDDSSLENDLLSFLDKAKDDKNLLDVKNPEQASLLFDAYYDTFAIASKQSFAEKLSEFILLNCTETEAFSKTLQIAYATGITSLSLSKLIELKYGSR